jgi:lipoate-protein ligase A
LESTARRKVPGGKLLSVRLEHNGHAVTAAELSGDFFIHPEESIAVIEEALVGTPLAIGKEELVRKIEAVMSRGRIMAVGFGPQDIATVVCEAMR